MEVMGVIGMDLVYGWTCSGMCSNRFRSGLGGAEMALTFRNKVTVSPDDTRVNDAFAIKVVAWVAGDGSWCAYYGPSDWSDESIACCGDALSQEVGEKLFYVLAASGRRYGVL